MIETLDITSAKTAPPQMETPQAPPGPQVKSAGEARVGSRPVEAPDTSPYRVVLCCSSRAQTED